MWWNHKRSIFKNHRNCLPLGLGVRSRQNPVRRLRNPPLKLNKIAIECSDVELARWAVSAIFENWPFVIYPHFLLFDRRKCCVLQIFLLRSIKAYLCPNIVNFDSVDFSERRPWRSDKFLLTRSVYLPVGFEALASSLNPACRWRKSRLWKPTKYTATWTLCLSEGRLDPVIWVTNSLSYSEVPLYIVKVIITATWTCPKGDSESQIPYSSLKNMWILTKVHGQQEWWFPMYCTRH